MPPRRRLRSHAVCCMNLGPETKATTGFGALTVTIGGEFAGAQKHAESGSSRVRGLGKMSASPPSGHFATSIGCYRAARTRWRRSRSRHHQQTHQGNHEIRSQRISYVASLRASACWPIRSKIRRVVSRNRTFQPGPRIDIVF
jgi:hypothetical protein